MKVSAMGALPEFAPPRVWRYEATEKSGRGNAPIAESGGWLEREAERAAELVTAGKPLPKLSSLAGQERMTAPPVAREVITGSGQPLEEKTRQSLGRSFGHDFSRVRVHNDSRAQESARAVNAQAYTVGTHVVFGAGRYAPATGAGERLLAHELAHVVQQKKAHGFQRQPAEGAAGNDPPRKTLKSEGVDLNDPVAGTTAGIIDAVLLRNQKLAPYFGDRLKGGFRIAAKGKFVHDTTDGNFDDAYRKAYDVNSGDTVPKSTKGFLDPKKSEIHLRPGAAFGTALHESVHRLASPRLYSQFLPVANKISSELTAVLAEGVTAFFTDTILKEEGLPNFNDAYRSQKKKAESLISGLGTDGFDLMAKFNFQGSQVLEIGEKLGFTSKQWGEAKGNGLREVLKKMEKLL